MYEEKNVEGEERESYVDELVAEFKRIELNEIALSLGLNPADYPNKRAIAEAILKAREREEAPIEGKVTAHPVEEEALEEIVEEEVEKVSPDTVRGKMEAIMEKAVEFKTFARAFQNSAQKLVKDYENYMKTEFKPGVKAFYESVKEQVKENEAALAALKSGVQELMSSIQEQVKENKNFVKQFYG